MRCTGDPRGAPRIDGEQANACAEGCNACVARVTREGHPGSTASRRTPAQKERLMDIIAIQIVATAALLVAHLVIVVRNRLTQR
jgi:hypothetical protein